MQPEHAEEEELAGEGRDEDQAEQAGERGRPGELARGVDERERREQDRCGQHVPGCENGAGDVANLQLAIDASARVRERREHDGECPRDDPPATRGIEADQCRDSQKAQRYTGDAQGTYALVGQEPCREKEREYRHGRLRDAGDARVDVRLSPGHEPHRHRRVDHAQHEARSPGGAQLPECARGAHPPCEIGEEQQPGQQNAKLGHGCRRDVLDGDLDEEERRAPHRREEQDQRPVRAHGLRLPRERSPACGLAPPIAAILTSVTEHALHRALGLTDGEYERIRSLLGRDPNDFELAVFSLLWSEHCGYKHSALLLKRLPSTGPRVLQGPGENAGVLDLGDGLAVAFKVESHNHPSAVEPFQGAATGVGGILRDIVAMGARPVALLDGLRFAEPDWHFSRAVGGIGHYGNCVGVPTVGGEAVFDEAYRDNCLVNAMCVGLLPVERLMRAKATAAGHHVVLYGATTGRDGIGGASVLASQELDDAAAEKRPSVQIGDPFTGKKLIEASVELVSSGLVESLQDCGAAGIASSLSEMAADLGIDVHLDRVPLREEGMEPWEVMISESQERMIAIVRPQMLGAVEAVLDRRELEHAVVGEVTAHG